MLAEAVPVVNTESAVETFKDHICPNCPEPPPTTSSGTDAPSGGGCYIHGHLALQYHRSESGAAYNGAGSAGSYIDCDAGLDSPGLLTKTWVYHSGIERMNKTATCGSQFGKSGPCRYVETYDFIGCNSCNGTWKWGWDFILGAPEGMRWERVSTSNCWTSNNDQILECHYSGTTSI